MRLSMRVTSRRIERLIPDEELSELATNDSVLWVL
jgi:hypothetical protein